MNKTDYILSRCQDKHVLDLGCIQDDARIDTPKWLHRQIYEVAKSVVGVDINSAEVPSKYKIVQQDIERLSEHPISKEKYDTIVAGDIIEHLFNPGLVIDEIKKIDFKELVIATPNVKSYRYWTLGKDKCRDDHTCWYSVKTLTQLLEMKGLKVIDQSFGFGYKVNGIRPLIKYLIYKLLPQTGTRLLITATK